jgi:hypothetical protein
MTFELETIIKSKFFNELTFEEILALSEYCSNEAEFNVLKEMFTASDLYQEENTHLDPAVKDKLDVLFNATYSEKNKQVSPILQFKRYKRPIFYLAAASVIFLVAFLFLRFNSNEPNKLAETPKQKKDIAPKNNTKENKNNAPIPIFKEKEKTQVATIDMPKTINADKKFVPAPYGDDMMLVIQDDDIQGNGTYAFTEPSEKEEVETSDMEYRSVAARPINAMPEMLDVLFAAY